MFPLVYDCKVAQGESGGSDPSESWLSLTAWSCQNEIGLRSALHLPPHQWLPGAKKCLKLLCFDQEAGSIRPNLRVSACYPI